MKVTQAFRKLKTILATAVFVVGVLACTILLFVANTAPFPR